MELLVNTTSTNPTLLTNNSSATRNVLLQLAAGVAFGMLVFYGVAFSESPLAHNAAHDVRHVTVKPCH